MARSPHLTDPKLWAGRFQQIALAAQSSAQYLVFLGDSMIEGWGATDIFDNYFSRVTVALNARYKIDGVTGHSYYERNADFAFAKPALQNLGWSGTVPGANTAYGLGRRGNRQGQGTARFMTTRAGDTAVMVKLFLMGPNAAAGTADGYVIDIDGTPALTVLPAAKAARGPVEHWVKMPNPSATHKVTVTFTEKRATLDTPIIEKMGGWNGPLNANNEPARGLLVIDGAKSQTLAAEFTKEGPNASNPAAQWTQSVPRQVRLYVIAWKTNDATKYTAAQYETHIRRIIALVRPTVGDETLIALHPPQHRKVGTVKDIEADPELYIDALYRIAADTPWVYVKAMSDVLATGTGLISDGVHPTPARAVEMAAITDKMFAGEYVDGAIIIPPTGPGTGTTPVNTTPPTVNLLTPGEDEVIPYNGTKDFTYQVVAASGKTIDPARQGIFSVGGGSLGTPVDLGNGVWGVKGVTYAQLAALPNRNSTTSGKGWNVLSFHTEDPQTVYTRTGSRSVFLAAAPVDTENPGGGTPPATTIPGTGPQLPNGGAAAANRRLPTEADVNGVLDLVSGGGGATTDGRVLDVKAAFGARGDGVTDDTIAINRALAASMAPDGAAVYFPPGDYSVTTIGVDYSGTAWAAQADSGAPYGYPGPRVYGAGSHKTRIVQRAGSTGDVFRVVGKTGTDAGPANNNKVAGLVLENLTIVGVAGGGHGLYLRTLVNCTFRNIAIRTAKSGVYLARETFVSGVDDEYSYANSFHGVKLVSNREWGFECSGTASIGGSLYDVEAIGNALGGFKLAPTNMTLTGCQAIGNGKDLIAGRGLLAIANTNTTSVNSTLKLVNFRSEESSTPGGYEIEIQSGISFSIDNPNVFATHGAHGIGLGLADGKKVLGLHIEGGFYGVTPGSGQKVLDIGPGAFDTNVKLGQINFSADNIPSDFIRDNGIRTSIEWPGNVRFLHTGPLAFSRVLPSNAVVPAIPGQVQLYARMTTGGKQAVYAQFESGAAQLIIVEP
jgi:hypothetical protein